MLLFHEPLPKGDALVVMSLIGLWHEQPVYAHHTVQVGSSAQIEEFCSLGLTGLTNIANDYVREHGEADGTELHTQLSLLPIEKENHDLILGFLHYKELMDSKGEAQTEKLLHEYTRHIPEKDRTHKEVLRTLGMGLYVQLREKRSPLFTINFSANTRHIHPADMILQHLWGMGKSKPAKADLPPWCEELLAHVRSEMEAK